MREVDYTASVAFLRKFFEFTEGDVELRAVSSNGAPPAVIFPANKEQILTFCRLHDSKGKAIYFGAATRSLGSSRGRREDLAQIVCALIDIDTKNLELTVDEVVAVLKGCPCPPSIIINSGYGVHAYWLLHEPIDVTGWGRDEDEAYTALLKRLVGCFAGDLACTDLPRIMRLPGTHNSKKTEAEPEGGWRLCRVLDENDNRYELGDLAEMLDQLGGPLIVAPEVEQGGASSVPFNQPIIGDPDDERDAFLGYGKASDLFDLTLLDQMVFEHPTLSIHAIRVPAIASMVRLGHEAEAIFDKAREATVRAAGLAGDKWNWRQEDKLIRDEIASAYRKYPPPDRKVVQLRPGQSARPDEEPLPAEPAVEFLGYPLNDLGNTMRMLAMHGEDMRYCVNAGWYLWDKRRFAFDPEGTRVRKLAQATAVRMRQVAAKLPAATEAQKKTAVAIFKYAIASGNKKGIDGMLSEARPQVRISVPDLDADPMLLNCRNGTVDLRTGEFRQHDRQDLLSKLAGADYDPAATCPQWEKFVAEIFDGDQALIDFVQRALGYSLTGDTREEVIFILHGSGANGKTKLIETMAAVMGDYGKYSPAETWTTGANPRPAYDLASLVGARFVPVVETDRGRQLAEARIKQATGGDKLPAEHKYKDPFEYQPQFKLWFATNHRPKIKGSDYAIWRRVYLIPFLVKFVSKEEADDQGGRRIKDPELLTKLKSELPGILAWMVRGCMEWRRRKSLEPPQAVVVATQDYQESEDNISGFITERCNVRRSLSYPFGLLYAGYLEWCTDNDEEAQSQKAFGFSLNERGHSADRTMSDRRRKGIDLKYDFVEKAKQRQAEERAKPIKTADTDEKSNS